MQTIKTAALGLPLSALAAELPEQPAFRIRQLWEWLHRHRAPDFAAMKNLPTTLRQELAARLVITQFRESEHLIAQDLLTEKWLYFSSDPTGKATAIETALIHEQRGKRRTLCVSCMSGCPVRCVFCATGRDGLERNLTAAEIVEQIYRAENYCRASAVAGLTNIVFMGMGEPLLNYAAVTTAAQIIGDATGMNFGNRQITISTVGIPEKIEQLAREFPAYRLAFSLHAPEQKLRERLIPLAKNFPLPRIIAALKFFASRTSRRITIEYCLIAGVNDSTTHARAVKNLLHDLPATVNLIPYNPAQPIGGFDAPNESMPLTTPSRERVRAFQEALRMPTTVRMKKGGDINAACGQLRARQPEQLNTDHQKNNE